MKILVCVKSVPREVIRPGVSDDGRRVQYEFLGQAMNESDEYALEQALSLRNSIGGEVLVVSVGTLVSQDVLYTGMAKGADQAIRIDSDSQHPDTIATLLARAAQKLGIELVLTGVESWDTLASQVGLLAAAKLGVLSVYAVTDVATGESPGSLTVTRELGGGISQVLDVPLPALLAIQSGGQTLRYVPPNKVMLARRRALTVLSAADLGLSPDGLRGPEWYEIIEVRLPERKRQAEIIEGNGSTVAAAILERVGNVVG